MKIRFLLLTCLLGASMASAQQTPAPALLFSDLIAGPATGNSDSTFTSNGGVYVRIYGNFFGATQGTSTLTMNGVSCFHVITWGETWRWYQRITAQLTGTCTTGNIVVTTANGTSNGLPFTVNAGAIHYVATTGSDSNSGTFASPWKTLPHAVQTAGTSPGNIVYVHSNVQQLVDDGQWSGALTIRSGWSHGTDAQPDALIGYPGATGIQIGNGSQNGLDTSDFTAGDGAPAGKWVFAELTFRGTSAASFNGGDNYRFIGNDLSNGNVDPGAGAAWEEAMTTHMKAYGNYFHDLNLGTTQRLAQGVYPSTDANHTDIGWNEIYNTKGRTGMQVHSSPVNGSTGYIMFDIQIHDNMIHNTAEECILVDTVDPSQGTIAVYNNVVWNCGQDGSGDSLHHQLSGDFNSAHGAGTSPPPVRWYNNTVYTTGGNSCWGSSYPDIHSGFTTTNFLQNNICYSTNSVPYWGPQNYGGSGCSSGDTTSACQSMTGNTNMVFGNGTPTFTAHLLSGSINSDPKFVTNGSNFALQSGSPAIGAGSTTAPVPAYDINGLVRPSPPSLGAYEFSAGVIVPKPAPPTNLTVVVQ